MTVQLARQALNLADLPDLAIEEIARCVVDRDCQPLEVPTDLLALAGTCKLLRVAALKTLAREYTVATMADDGTRLVLGVAVCRPSDKEAVCSRFLYALQVHEYVESFTGQQSLLPATVSKGTMDNGAIMMAVPAVLIRSIHVCGWLGPEASHPDFAILKACRSLHRLVFCDSSPLSLACNILSMPDIAARLTELVVANYQPFTNLSHLSLPNVRCLQLSGEYGTELDSLPDLPRCQVLDLDLLEFSITSVATLHRFLNLTTTLVELRMLNETLVWESALSQVALDDDYPHRFQHLKKATLDLPTFMTFVPTTGLNAASQITNLTLSADGRTMTFRPAPLHCLETLPLSNLVSLSGRWIVLSPRHLELLSSAPHLTHLDVPVDVEGSVDDVGSLVVLEGVQFNLLESVRSSPLLFVLLQRCILPFVTTATVVVTHREQHNVPLHLPTMPCASHLALENSKSTVGFTSRTLAISSDLAMSTPRLKMLSCEIPVVWTHPLKHHKLTNLTTPVAAWNGLRDRIDLPALKTLAFLAFARKLQDIEHVDPAGVPALSEIVLPRGVAVMTDALWDLTRLPALTHVRADPPVCFGPSLAEMRLLYTAPSVCAVWPLVSSGVMMGTVAHCTIVISTADVELDVALVEATVEWMLLQRALTVCFEVPVEVERKLGVQAFVDAMRAKFDGATIEVELLPASDVNE
ncbi:hypothetical protein AMAG_19842 [Allomyces macrogynus ATCC 38327]|uniref:Uncharacterized protein n=1 Tax=Allomyces macrogynus (strain ATCC 38327) TaxID=578462 RepID=A0A0L0SZW3_ALLM3|nr:hypothetical protein AMAG_19842 [Allomyces macrogynus ATCC 38327]|eukprot:KNE68073.1 hypothetical protein AMAG_19842 [Allomyces macrogynus ATCC 38327]